MNIDFVYVKIFFASISIFNGLMGYIQVFTNTTFFMRGRYVNFVVTWRSKYLFLMKVLELLKATFWIGLGFLFFLYVEQV